jgi:regulatory protein
MTRTPPATGRQCGPPADRKAAKRDPRKRVPNPLDPAKLDELALAYAARFATSAWKLRTYLRRKVALCGWVGDEDSAPPDIDGLVEQMVRAGYVDDEAFARGRGSGLLRRGYGARRIDETLRSAGVGEDLRGSAYGSERERREAALTMARKRGFGPFSRSAQPDQRPDPAAREKQLAAMLRAGHPLASARELVDAPSVRAAEDWVGEDDDE